MESPYDGIILHDTNHKSVTSLGNFKTWIMNMHTIYQRKTLGNGVETFRLSDTKNNYHKEK